MKHGAAALLVLATCSGGACTAILGTFDDDGTGGAGGAGGAGTASHTSSSSTTTSTHATTSTTSSVSTTSSSTSGFPPSCMDGTKDGSETDVDCGGAVCPHCADTKACLANTDCQSGFCGKDGFGPNTTFCYPASCNDHLKDGTETDVDCGGGACPKCESCRVCKVNSDCFSNMCVGGECF